MAGAHSSAQKVVKKMPSILVATLSLALATLLHNKADSRKRKVYIEWLEQVSPGKALGLSPFEAWPTISVC